MNALKRKVRSLLIASERYTKTDMPYLAQGGFWLSMKQGITTLVGLGLAVAFANLLPPETYGNYRYVLAIAGMLSAFTLSGLDTALLRAVSRGFNGALPYVFRLSLFGQIPLVIIALGGAVYYFINDNLLLTAGLLMIAVAQPFITSASYYGVYLIGRKQFRESAFYGTLDVILPSFALLITLLLTENLFIIFFTFFASHAISTLTLYALASRDALKESEQTQGITSYAAHLSVQNVLTTLAEHVDKILLFHFLGAGELAVYAFAIAIPNHMRGVFKSLYSLMFPRFANRSLASIDSGLAHKVILLLGVLIATLIIYIAIAPTLFDLLFPLYSESVLFSQAAALMLLGMVSLMPTTALHAHAATRELYIGKFISTGVRIGALVVLIYLFGIWGAVIAQVFAKLFDVALYFTLFKIKVKHDS